MPTLEKPTKEKIRRERFRPNLVHVDSLTRCIQESFSVPLFTTMLQRICGLRPSTPINAALQQIQLLLPSTSRPSPSTQKRKRESLPSPMHLQRCWHSTNTATVSFAVASSLCSREHATAVTVVCVFVTPVQFNGLQRCFQKHTISSEKRS